MTTDQLAKWLETGEDAPTIEEARQELLASVRTIKAMADASVALRDEMVAAAEAAMLDMHYRAERAAEYNLLSALSQRVSDITMIAGLAAQK